MPYDVSPRHMPPIPLLLSAGEASGDMYAARLATALQQRADVKLFGMGGPQMRAAGVDIITDYSEVSVVGITEILSHLPRFPRLPPPPRPQTQMARHAQRLLHLPAILGVASMARANRPPPLRSRPLYLPVRGKVLFRRWRPNRIHRPPARRPRQTDARARRVPRRSPIPSRRTADRGSSRQPFRP